jgi:prevent-host-death family protein
VLIRGSKFFLKSTKLLQMRQVFGRSAGFVADIRSLNRIDLESATYQAQLGHQARWSSDMDTVNLFDAKNRLSALVDQAEAGLEVTITRRGRPVARLVPVASEADKGRTAVQKLRALRQSIAARGETFTWDELKSYRDEGRR